MLKTLIITPLKEIQFLSMVFFVMTIIIDCIVTDGEVATAEETNNRIDGTVFIT